MSEPPGWQEAPVAHSFVQAGESLSTSISEPVISPPRELRPPEAEDPSIGGLPLSAWMKIAIVAALFCATFWSNLWRLWLKTNPINGQDVNWQHAILIPLVGIYYLYANREPLLAARRKPGWFGAVITLVGILLFGYGIWPGQNDFVKDFGMVVTLFGVVALLAGWSVMQIAWFPIVYLVCGIPWPGLVYSWVSGPLQRLAAKVAVLVLQVTGVDAQNRGTKIEMPGLGGMPRVLNVAEACSGLKSLMTFVSLAAAIAFLSARPLWQKIVIVVSAIPIAIFCNVMRVSGQGLLDHYVSPQLSESYAHQFVGVVMLIPAFFMILGVGWLLDRIFVDEVGEKPQPARKIIARARAGEAR